MHFAHPDFLWLLLLLPPLGWWWLRRRRAAVRHPAASGLGKLPQGRARWIKWLSLGLRLAIVGLLIIGLARLRWPDEQTRIPAQSVAIQMVLDVSGSMAEKDYALGSEKISRLEAARQAFRQFLLGDGGVMAGRGDDLVGLITFAARQESACPPTLTHSAILKMLDEAQPVGVPPDAATNIGDALILAIQYLEHARPEQKVIILLSDGEHNVPPEVVADAQKPRQAAAIAKARGMRMYAIYAGPETSATPSDGEQSLRDAAEMTGGQAFRAANANALLNVCRQIDALEKTRIESFQYFRYHEAYPWLGSICIVLLMNLLLLEGTRWRRLP